MKFSDKVRELRVKAGMTQQDFASAIGVSLRTVTNYETGDRYPKKREMYAKMAEVLGTDINYLLTENEEFIAKAS
ncbi:MAG: helix-turn-helix transcriptional regulator, partial [Clostridia bacterium]|nr:helix-turn-helix transcriptional regulator [Clostridia bacterium]